MRVPLEGGGRLVVEMTPDEAKALAEALGTHRSITAAPFPVSRVTRRFAIGSHGRV